MLELSKRDAKPKEQMQLDFPISGVPFLLRDYREERLDASMQWCYNILWVKPAGKDKSMWCVESCLRHWLQVDTASGSKSAPLTPTNAASGNVDAMGTPQQLARKRGRRGSAGSVESSAEEQTPSKRRAINNIELLLAEVPAEEEKESEAEKMSAHRLADAVTVEHSERPQQEAVKPELKGDKASESEEQRSHKESDSKQGAADKPMETASSTQTPTSDKHATNKTSSAKGKKEQASVDDSHTEDGGQSKLPKPLTVTEEADAAMTDNKDNSRTATSPTAERAAESKAGQPPTAPVTPTDSSAVVKEAAVAEDAPPAAVAVNSKSPATPLRHIPKKSGRLSSKTATSPLSAGRSNTTKEKEDTPPVAHPTTTANNDSTSRASVQPLVGSIVEAGSD